jgi:hypothetical protein
LSFCHILYYAIFKLFVYKLRTYPLQELIELEWPNIVAANRSNFVRISLIQTAEGYTPTIEVLDHEMVTGTPRVQATPGLPLAKTFGLDYAGFATAYLEGNHFTTQQVGQAEQPLDQERIDWIWNVSSDQPGEQYLNATIQMEWRHKAGGDPIQRQAWSSHLAVTVKPTFYRLTQGGLFPLITGLLGLILSVPGALFLKQRDTTTAEASDAFLGLPSTLYIRLRTTLLTCAPLESDTALRTLFIDARIAPWRDDLPYVDTPKQRAQTVINFLYAHTNIQGDNALVLFLRLLSEHHDPTDACHANIVSLAAELERVTHSMVE